MNKYLLIIAITILFVSGIIIADEFKEGINLTPGENTVNLSFGFNPIYAADLVKIYPEIKTITYSDDIEEIGYVNVFGGIGTNFIVYPNEIYKITVNKEVNLVLS